ncbi:unnamed protein product [Schistosoma curassoni]|uniref:Dynamin stalk domain-containing protein n=1 Tax=Schistosoma curassoni TaxID=6186 RepID=A0A183JRS1_9TREM|nr:unnamed protein product [Schistosoma curassoni]
MVQSFEAEFSQNISGHVADVNTQILSGGAEINRVFHERFRYDLLKIHFSSHCGTQIQDSVPPMHLL